MGLFYHPHCRHTPVFTRLFFRVAGCSAVEQIHHPKHDRFTYSFEEAI